MYPFDSLQPHARVYRHGMSGIMASGLMVVLASLLLGCAASRPGGAPKDHTKEAAGPAETGVRSENRKVVAHEFFIRARHQELLGNQPVALQYYRVALEYDPASRDLCFIVADRFKTAGQTEVALETGKRCLDLKGKVEAQEYELIGELHLRNGELEESARYYQLASSLDERNHDLLFTLASLYENLKEFDKQAEVMERLVPQTGYPVALVEKLAETYLRQGRKDLLGPLYRKAWEHTDNPLYGEKLALVHESRGEGDKLLEVVQHLAAESPRNVHYSLWLARAYLLLDRTDSALTVYERLMRENPEEEKFVFGYGSLLYEKGRHREAREVFHKLVKQYPERAVFRFYLGSAALDMGDAALGEEEIGKAIDLDSATFQYWARLGFHHVRSDAPEKAFALLERLETMFPDNWYTWYLSGVLWNQAAARSEATTRKGVTAAARDRSDETVRQWRQKALGHLRKAQGMNKEEPRVLFELGVVQERIGMTKDAIATFRELIRRDGQDAIALNYLGYMLVEEGRELDYAISLIDRALEIQPANGAILDSKGWWFYKKRDFDNARKYLEMALQHLPDDTTVLEHYAMVLEKLGRSEEARQQWLEILKRDPQHADALKKAN